MIHNCFREKTSYIKFVFLWCYYGSHGSQSIFKEIAVLQYEINTLFFDKTQTVEVI